MIGMRWHVPVSGLHIGVKLDRGELGLLEDLVERVCTLLVSNKDDDLVEVEDVHEISKLARLLRLLKFHVELAETMKRQLVHVDEDLLGLQFHKCSQNIANQSRGIFQKYKPLAKGVMQIYAKAQCVVIPSGGCLHFSRTS